MNDARPPSRNAADLARSDRAVAVAGMVTLAWFVATVWPMWRFTRMTGVSAPLAAHCAMLAFGAVALGSRRAILRPARDWFPLLAGPLIYVELRWIIAAFGGAHHDPVVMAWEATLFPSNPSATLALRAPVLALSEALHLSYASYYLLVGLPPIALYARGRRDAFAATLLALTLVYAACFVAYALFPVDGPRYLLGPALAPNGPVRDFVLALLERGSSRGTAFPSSHVAASVTSALCALQHQRAAGLVVAVMAAALTVATVYGGFHYAVDALAGLVLGVVAWAVSRAVWHRL